MRSPNAMTDAEREVMLVLWRRAPVAASAVVEELHGSKQWSLATVRTLLRRLVRKHAVSQEIQCKRYIYRPLVSLETHVYEESESFWNRVLCFAPWPGLRQLIIKANLSTEHIRELRHLLRERDKHKRRE